MHNTLGRIWRRGEVVDKIMLRTYARAAANLYEFYGQVSFRTWMMSIALRESRSEEGWAEAIDAFECLPGQVYELTNEQKLTALLHKVTGLGEREIACCLGARPEDIRQQIKLVRDLIRKRMLVIPQYDHSGELPESLIRNFMQTYLNNTGRANSWSANTAEVLESHHDPIPPQPPAAASAGPAPVDAPHPVAPAARARRRA